MRRRPLAVIVLLLAGCVLPGRRQVIVTYTREVIGGAYQADEQEWGGRLWFPPERTEPQEAQQHSLRAERQGALLALQLTLEATRTWQERTGHGHAWGVYRYEAAVDIIEIFPFAWLLPVIGAVQDGVPGLFFGLAAILPAINLGWEMMTGHLGPYDHLDPEPLGETTWDPWEPRSEVVTRDPIRDATIELLAADGVTLLTVVTGPDGRAAVHLEAERTRLFGGDLPPVSAFAPAHGARCTLPDLGRAGGGPH